MNRKLSIAGLVCVAIFLVPALLLYRGDPNVGWLVLPFVPIGLIGVSLILIAALRKLFLGLGYDPAIATPSVGLIAIAQYFIGTGLGQQGMVAFASAILAWCGGALLVIAGVMWLRSLDRNRGPR